MSLNLVSVNKYKTCKLLNIKDMMNNLQSSAFVAKTTQLLSSVAHLRLLLVMFLTLTASAEVWGADATATLSFADKAQRTSFSTTQQVWEQNGVTFTNNKASSTSNVADYANPARLYANSNVIVEHTSKQITQIVFDCNSSSYATAMKNSIGTVSDATVSVSSDKVTVTFASAVESFTIAKLTAQVRLDAITVTYTEEVVTKESATIVLSEAGTESSVDGTFYEGDSYTLPSSTDAQCGDKVLVGWSTEEIAETDTKPTYYSKGESVSLDAGENKFYAVFATESETTSETTTTPTTASLSFASTDQRTSYSTSEQIWEQNGITLTNDKSASTSSVGDYSNPARFYKSSKITIEFTSKISQIVFACSSSDYATALKNSIVGATVTVSDNTVTAVLTTPATSFIITSLSGQVRMNSLEITYETTTSGGTTINHFKYSTSCITETTVSLIPKITIF